jgi:hypothetical protein
MDAWTVEKGDIVMTTDFQFSLENRPGTGAQALDALGQAGVNVIGACALSGGTEVHLAVESQDADRARQALQGAGVQMGQEREVVVTQLEDRPGAGAALLRRIAQAGVNVEFLYLATNTRIILGADDPQKLQSAL